MRLIRQPLALPLLMLFLTALPGSASTFEAVSPAYTDAVNQYNTRHYNVAVERLNSVLATQPDHVMSHYYLALSYQALNQIGSARAEYNWINTHAVDARLRHNAQYALTQINQWSQTRAYAGNGNVFQYQASGPMRRRCTISGAGPTMVRT
jgi:hypothetical protein